MSPMSSPPGRSVTSRVAAEREAGFGDFTDTPRRVVVRETRNSKFQQTISVGPHLMLADEPVAAGGEGHAGPALMILLAASAPAPR